MKGNRAPAAIRRQTASELELVLAWSEAGAALQREFNGDFVAFEKWAEAEAIRLLESVGEWK
jgi:hypothetical protein